MAAVPTSPYQSWPQQIAQMGGAFGRSLGAPQKPAPPQPSQTGTQLGRQTGQGAQGMGQGGRAMGTPGTPGMAGRLTNWAQGLNKVQQTLPQGQTVGGMANAGGMPVANQINAAAAQAAPGNTGWQGGAPAQNVAGGLNQNQMAKAAWKPNMNNPLAGASGSMAPTLYSGGGPGINAQQRQQMMAQKQARAAAMGGQPPAAPGAPTTVPPQQAQAQQQSQAQQMAAQLAPQQQAQQAAPQGPVVQGGGYRPAQTSMQDQLSAMLRQQPGAM